MPFFDFPSAHATADHTQSSTMPVILKHWDH